MKKFFTILLMICLMVSVLSIASITAFAADAPADEPAAGTVLRISALKKDGTPAVIKDYDNFKDGWNAAIKLAENEDEMRNKSYDRVVVDLYADWTAKSGSFGSGDGFDSGIIQFPTNTRVTLNLNGHTIDRDLSDWKWSGEVIYVDEKANVIINNGTITGGWSGGGAGGIHIDDGAQVELNDVNIKDNTSDDDDGGGIAIYDNATLIVNGGSFENNKLDGGGTEGGYSSYYGGAVYVNDSTAVFNGVTFKNNYTVQYDCFGAAIYAAGSNITISECTFDGNGRNKGSEKNSAPMSTIHADDSSITVQGSTFVGNGDKYYSQSKGGYSAVFLLEDSTLIMKKGEANNSFSGNAAHFLFNDTDDSTICVSDTDFVDNASAVLYGDNQTSADSYFKNCTFKNNKNDKFVSFYDVNTTLIFFDCDMGDSTFGDKSYLQFVNEKEQTPGEVPAEGTVLRVSGLKRDGTLVAIKDYKNFEDGWNAAMTLADDSSEMKKNDYSRVVVDMYANWNSSGYWNTYSGKFGEGKGFKWDTICFASDVRMTLNLNGFTIDRNVPKPEADGEVIYIDSDADVIINNGTIRGGWSDTGAGGIQIKGGAKVTLNNVNITGNSAEDDHGSAIAMYGGAELIMNGGSISHNLVYSEEIEAYGTVYVDGGSTVVLNDVTISENDGLEGAALYIEDGKVTLNNCTIENNETNDYMYSLICIYDGELIINGGEIKNNGDFYYKPYTLFLLYDDIKVSISDGCKITGNQTSRMYWQAEGSDVYFNISESEITDNFCPIYPYGSFVDKASYTYTECKFNNNNRGGLAESVFIGTPYDETALINCEFGDTTFTNKQYLDFGNGVGVGSIFGEGSLSMIVSILSLIASGVAIFLTVYYNKKKAVPATANNATETDEEE